MFVFFLPAMDYVRDISIMSSLLAFVVVVFEFPLDLCLTPLSVPLCLFFFGLPSVLSDSLKTTILSPSIASASTLFSPPFEKYKERLILS